MTGLSAKTAVIYFSATGTTERMAKGAAASMGADIFEIQPVHKYSDADLNWHHPLHLCRYIRMFSLFYKKNPQKL